MALSTATVVVLILLSSVHFTDSDLVQFPNFNKCYDGNIFLTLKNISFKRCRSECQLRRLCKAANYWRQKRTCDLVDTDITTRLHLSGFGQSCVSFSRSHLPEVVTCDRCGDGKVCDPVSDKCIIKECKSLNVDNGHVVGNMLQVGSRTKVICDENYIPEPLNSRPVCQVDAEWDTMPKCVHVITCGDDPVIANADLVSKAGMGKPGTVLGYICQAGYVSTLAYEGIYTVSCQSDGVWTNVNLECKKSCGPPPTIAHASMSPSSDAREGFNYYYQCQTKYKVTRNGVVTTETNGTVVCNRNGDWDGIFQCVLECVDTVVMVTGPNGISDSQITSSSYIRQAFGPHNGRFNNHRAWAAGFLGQNEYIQFDFSSPKIVLSVYTQGFSGQYVQEWITSYKILYSTDCDSFIDYGMVLPGNSDPTNVAANFLDPPILARCVRINPKTWRDWITTRVELIGC